MRWTWWHFGALAAIGILLTVVSLSSGWPWGGFFLLLPLVFPPLRFGKSATDAPDVKRCDRCGFYTHDKDFEFCPRDGTTLVRAS